jgi:hypothetical protein
MSKNTPGPWRVESTPALDGTPYIQVLCNFDDGTENVVCRMGISDGESWGGYVGEVADAHLIAAAPDMLEALEECLLYLNNNETRDLARAAIKKARGEK